MKKSSIFLVYLPTLLLAGLLLPAISLDARAQQQHPLGRYVEPSDGPHVYVVGAVVKPQAFLFKAPFTVTQAIAAAGGLRGDARKDRVRVVRTDPTGGLEATIITVDLKAIRKRRAPDFLLQPHDIIDVAGRRASSGHNTPIKLPKTPTRVIH